MCLFYLYILVRKIIIKINRNVPLNTQHPDDEKMYCHQRNWVVVDVVDVMVDVVVVVVIERDLLCKEHVSRSMI